MVADFGSTSKRGKVGGDKVAMLYEIKTKMVLANVVACKHVAHAMARMSSKNRRSLVVAGGDFQFVGGSIPEQGWDDNRTGEPSPSDLSPSPPGNE